MQEEAIRPKTFAHIVYRTYQFDTMLAWYVKVFNAKVQYQNPVIAFVTYDDEHHRVALLNLSIIKGESSARAPRGQPGMDHVAYGYRSLTELMHKYVELKGKAITPYWCIHHGITVSLYYADPDGNQMEFQADCFASNDDANTFMYGPNFEVNPIGVEFDPEDMLRRLQAGETEADLLPRREQLPVSGIRGSLLGD
ncbi:biphenyl 2,3-dioxygenase [Variovorax dokdonensis]|uniref:Biphenyl 2,3-dioxygenase n=1 Tax=Variovorax dokdonensis TaxID=344883 RepID=A0ABT7N912_9BURK|nr:VOC family protein [Variovorax dokdonensis]MDM0044403.1 biphenyl 2,3-dioxygenase [Variovorax dokdonensis]